MGLRNLEDDIDKTCGLLGVAGEGEKGTMSDTWISDRNK